MLSILRRRDFALLWSAGLISVAGDWVLYAALPFYVYQLTGSTIATAGMVAAELTPGVLLGTVAGVFVDRWDRKRLMAVANVIQAVAVASLFVVPHGFLWVVYVAAAVQSSIAAFAVPAESALLPSLVEDRDLVAANALNALNNRIARLVGVPIGGALLGLAGLESVVVVDCASFLCAALLVAAMTTPRVGRSRATDDAAAAVRSAWSAFWKEWADGLRVVRQERTIAVIFFVLGLMTYGGTMLDPLYPAWVKDVLGEGPEAYAWLLTAHAAFGIVGTVLLGRYGTTLAPRQLIGWTSLLAGVANLVKFNLPSLALALSISALVGITSVISSVGVDTLIQRGVPDEYRGRVFGALGASGALLSLLGAATGGLFAGAVGVVPMLDFACGLIVLAGLVVLWAFAPSRSPQVDFPPAMTSDAGFTGGREG